MPTFAAPGPIAATVAVAGARVRIAASDRTGTVVRVEPVDEASRRDVRVARETKVGFSNGQLTVKTTVSGDENGSVAISIDLPAGSSLVTYLTNSRVDADGPLGECELHVASSQARFGRIDALRADIAAGQVTVGHIAGPADIHGGAAAIDIDRADGSVTAKTGDGPIRIARLTRGRAELANGAGNIEVGIGPGTSAQVDASSEKGSVRNSLPEQEDTGAFPDQVTVDARTRHGDIIIRRAAR